MEREVAIDYIKSLKPAEIAEFFNDALRPLDDGALSGVLTVYRLAECFMYQKPDDQQQESLVVHLVASPLNPAECAENLHMDRYL